uniref:SFRICE_032492 n=1 Tax=Spodoptera frugiperda TaxID=7108 RepID=A0A2H1X2W7_SPOFR
MSLTVQVARQHVTTVPPSSLGSLGGRLEVPTLCARDRQDDAWPSSRLVVSNDMIDDGARLPKSNLYTRDLKTPKIYFIGNTEFHSLAVKRFDWFARGRDRSGSERWYVLGDWERVRPSRLPVRLCRTVRSKPDRRTKPPASYQ